MLRRTGALLAVLAAFAATAPAADKPAATPEGKAKVTTGPLQFKMKDIKGKDVELADYKGKVVLFVNVASKCGYTKQYKGLQELYEKFKDDGLVVIGVPANEFGGQEPGTDQDIAKFCESRYKVTFPMMAKVVVKEDKAADDGDAATAGKIAPLYKFLTDKTTNPKFAGDIGWNFEKFLVAKNGEVVGRYKSGVEPMSDKLVDAVKKELAEK